MKKFEKWYCELPIREDAEDFTISTYKLYKKAWKAALEWAADQIRNDTNGYFNILKELEKCNGRIPKN